MHKPTHNYTAHIVAITTQNSPGYDEEAKREMNQPSPTYHNEDAHRRIAGASNERNEISDQRADDGAGQSIGCDGDRRTQMFGHNKRHRERRPKRARLCGRNTRN